MKITTDNKQFKQATVSLQFVERNIPKAYAATLNRVGSGLKTEASRQLRKTYDIKHKDIIGLGNIKVTKANGSKLQMLLTSKGRNIPLIRFRVSPSKPSARAPAIGARVSVKKSGGKRIPGAFVQQMPSGHLGVFRRASKQRLPVDQLYGPAVPVMLNEPGVAEHLQEEAQKRIATRLDHEVNRVLGRLKTT